MSTDYKLVFVALDGGDTQDMVAKKAVRIASNNQASIVMGHVVDAVPTEATSYDLRNICDQVHLRIQDELAETIKEAEDDPNIPSIDLRVDMGTIQETLGLMLEDVKPDLIVCGERGLSKIRYAFVGSVSTHLIRTADCDVLVVKQH